MVFGTNRVLEFEEINHYASDCGNGLATQNRIRQTKFGALDTDGRSQRPSQSTLIKRHQKQK
jgi:hypothetical protein